MIPALRARPFDSKNSRSSSSLFLSSRSPVRSINSRGGIGAASTRPTSRMFWSRSASIRVSLGHGRLSAGHGAANGASRTPSTASAQRGLGAFACEAPSSCGCEPQRVPLERLLRIELASQPVLSDGCKGSPPRLDFAAGSRRERNADSCELEGQPPDSASRHRRRTAYPKARRSKIALRSKRARKRSRTRDVRAGVGEDSFGNAHGREFLYEHRRGLQVLRGH